jgi:hypothetical protein
MHDLYTAFEWFFLQFVSCSNLASSPPAATPLSALAFSLSVPLVCAVFALPRVEPQTRGLLLHWVGVAWMERAVSYFLVGAAFFALPFFSLFVFVDSHYIYTRIHTFKHLLVA